MSCGNPCPAPNVRCADSVDEKDALSARYDEALISARARGTVQETKDFESQVPSSTVTTCMPDDVMQRIAKSDSEVYQCFYQQLHSGQRRPVDNEFDNFRESHDSKLFPYYKDHMVFGALSLGELGISYYGGFCCHLKEVAVQTRTSVFEENVFNFVKNHKLAADDPIPAGFRASWQERGKLAVSKLHSSIEKGMGKKEFIEVLLPACDTPGEEDFIEAHIYKGFNRGSIETVTSRKANGKAEKAVQSIIRKHLVSAGVSLKVVH
ncbi:MAG: hypothetical protein V3V10_10270 [Planctomycetota bacterium]